MTLTLTVGSGSLFDRLGEIGGEIVRARGDLREEGTYVLGNRTIIESLVQLTESGDIQEEEDIAAPLRTAVDVFRLTGWLQYASVLRTVAERTLKKMVWRDNPRYLYEETSRVALKEALLELRRQMIAVPKTLQRTAIVVTGSAITGTGNGALVTSKARGDGLTNELAFAETGLLRCDLDSYRDGATVNREWFYYYGRPKLDGMHPDWGESGYGSGANTLIKVIDPTAFDPLGNLLTNSFETATANVFANWYAAVGTAGADFASTTTAALVYFGSTALKFIGGTAVATKFEQTFNTSTTSGSGAGTLGRIYGSTAYAVIVRLKAETGVPASGVIRVRLANSAGTTLNDDAGTANSFDCTLSTLSTSDWTNFSGTFRPPKTMAAGAKLIIEASTVIPAGTNVAIDGVAFAKMTPCYLGGPFACLFAGSTPFIRDDFFTIATTNDYGGAAHARANFHMLLDSLYDMKAMDLLLNSASSPDISDGAIA